MAETLALSPDNLKNGIFPHQLKIFCVCPIYKNDPTDQQLLTNLCHFSLKKKSSRTIILGRPTSGVLRVKGKFLELSAQNCLFTLSGDL